jgi:hypothetical protein
MFWKKKPKIGEFKCPRCGTKQYYNDEESFRKALEQPYDLCVNCYAPLRLKAEGNNIVMVERIKEQIELEFNIPSESCGQTFNYKEKSMLDSEYEYLKRLLGMLDGEAMMKSGESMIAFGHALEGKAEKSVYWQQRAREEGPWEKDLNRLYVRCPYQVLQITYRMNKFKHLVSLSKKCFRCELPFPNSFAKCPFCGYES